MRFTYVVAVFLSDQWVARMVDAFDSAKRSQVMSRIRGRDNQTTELKLSAAFRMYGVVGWRRQVRLKPRIASKDRGLGEAKFRLSVRPDFIFRSHKLAVFVDGCFWHGCPEHFKQPVTNSEFWANKIAMNLLRDQRATRALEEAGWTVLRVWEHDLADLASVIKRVVSCLSRIKISP